MKQTTAVAISGGVDSLMSAYLLREQGQHVIGIHFITGFEPSAPSVQGPSADRLNDIREIGKQLGIPVEIVDIRSEFKEKIVDYFTCTYQRGQTPNPCMKCNPEIKFGTILAQAFKLGAHKLATGHYAGINEDQNGRFHLLKGLDPKKDQSYFLARLTQQQLAKACFPLGKLRKEDVKRMAVQKGLRPISRQESQDVCFIKHGDYGDFLARQAGLQTKHGLIEDTAGKVLGTHRGLHLFTVGQRRGINCPAAQPYYVVRLDIERNRLVVGSKTDLLTTSCRVADINWIITEPVDQLEVNTRVRYRSREVPSTVFPLDGRQALVRFKAPQSAVTPGQAAVFYKGDEILGGGWISPQGCMCKRPRS
jgi:tRNA-uridine 2-sulfurtransferase